MKRIVIGIFVTLYPISMFVSCYLYTFLFENSSLAMMLGFLTTDLITTLILVLILCFKMDKQIEIAIERFIVDEKLPD